EGELARGILSSRPEDERVEPELEDEAREGLDPARDGPLQDIPAGVVSDLAHEVVRAPDLRRVAAGVRGALVDPALPVRDRLRRRVGERGDPAVGDAAYQAEHSWLVGADPDLDGVRR